MNLKIYEQSQNISTLEINNYLKKRKVDPKYKGFTYLRSAIKRCIKDREKPIVVNQLMMDIAKDYNTYPVQVYKNIIYALYKSLDSKFGVKQFIVIAVFELTN